MGDSSRKCGWWFCLWQLKATEKASDNSKQDTGNFQRKFSIGGWGAGNWFFIRQTELSSPARAPTMHPPAGPWNISILNWNPSPDLPVKNRPAPSRPSLKVLYYLLVIGTIACIGDRQECQYISKLDFPATNSAVLCQHQSYSNFRGCSRGSIFLEDGHS